MAKLATSLVGQRAFTLIEVLVALLVGAIVAVLAFRGVSSLVDARQQLDAGATRWLAIHRFFDLIEADLRFALPRPGRDAQGTPRPALLGQNAPVVPFGVQLALMQDAGAPDSPPRRVGYRFAEGRIEFLRWSAADLPPYGEPVAITLLEGVRSWSLRYLGADGVWRDQWAPAQLSEMPRGVEVRLEMADAGVGGPITRVLAR